jgi:hypothetical protein
MTNLAWIIYGAEVSQNMVIALGIMLVLVGLATFIGVIDMVITANEVGANSKAFASAKSFTKKAALATAGVFFFASILPSRNAIMMMAAANYGNELYKSDLKEFVSPSKELLKNWINDQLQEKKK